MFMTALLAVAAGPTPARGQADVALCNIPQVTGFGSLDGIVAYSIGSTTVNLGDVNLQVVQSTPAHPVLAQQMYRLLHGRFEQVGMSWVRHDFCALQLASPCTEACTPAGGGCASALGPGCESSNTASRNGAQTVLGPRWQVNPVTGTFPFPADQQFVTGNTIFKRLQVHEVDLALPEAIYFVEGLFVAPDDAAAGNQADNVSYRPVSIGPEPNYEIGFISGQPTAFGQPAIQAWQAHGNGLGQADPGVAVEEVMVPGDGLFLVGHKVSDNGDGTWHYEYAVENLFSHRAARGFAVPVGAGVTVSGAGFHDVDYHSGDGEGGGGGPSFDGTDWAVSVRGGSGGAVEWTTDTYQDNPNANALRWGTLYNFRFDADAAPVEAAATITLYRPDEIAPDAVMVTVVAPGDGADACPLDLDGDGTVGISDLLALLAGWGSPWTIGDLLDLLAAWGPC